MTLTSNAFYTYLCALKKKRKQKPKHYCATNSKKNKRNECKLHIHLEKIRKQM